jgi:molecular chaperone GrpE
MPPATAEEVQELKDRLLRTLAEMENLRARTQREVEEARKFAVTGFARDLLEVGDNLCRALASVPAEARAQSEFMTNLVQGVEMTERSLRSALERHQVRRVSPQKGERFDHKLHQAMFEVPSAELAPGSVAEVIQDGYVLADRLLRPALVGVAKAPPDASPEQPGNRIDQSA